MNTCSQDHSIEIAPEHLPWALTSAHVSSSGQVIAVLAILCNAKGLFHTSVDTWHWKRRWETLSVRELRSTHRTYLIIDNLSLVGYLPRAASLKMKIQGCCRPLHCTLGKSSLHLLLIRKCYAFSVFFLDPSLLEIILYLQNLLYYQEALLRCNFPTLII